ncbi:hypothetical protein M1563_00795 [Patescibacteria group bacterium]|nr:hypothetical protein [Patescibacteria group bacterium]MCL5410153.1 hypothetical protein [Patescibacteria group bacterium]
MSSCIESGEIKVFVKRSIANGLSSGIPEGKVVAGKLVDPIKIGSSIRFSEGGHTTPVQAIVQDGKGRKFYITSTSRYEELDKEFSGLKLRHELGSVSLPADTQPAKIGSGEVVVRCQTSRGSEYQAIYINKDALATVLLETSGAQLFYGMHHRLFVLARVGNIHLPFYKSKNGTSGKNQGEWYPFFGYTGNWLVKGKVGQNGEMIYHPQVDVVARTLNQNLCLPLITTDGALVGSLSNLVPNFNINDHLTYLNSENDLQDILKERVRFVEKVTGYQVSSSITPYQNGLDWIKRIVSAIK